MATRTRGGAARGAAALRNRLVIAENQMGEDSRSVTNEGPGPQNQRPRGHGPGAGGSAATTDREKMNFIWDHLDDFEAFQQYMQARRERAQAEHRDTEETIHLEPSAHRGARDGSQGQRGCRGKERIEENDPELESELRHGQRIHIGTEGFYHHPEQVRDNPQPISYDQIEEMVARMIGNNGKEPNRVKGNPFALRIRTAHMPENIKIPPLDSYDGSADPQDHVCHVNAMLDLYGLEDDLRCRIFPTTLRGNARRWHNDIKPGSIQSYSEYCDLFISTFICSAKVQTNMSELSNVKQRYNEPLSEYLNRFNSVCLRVEQKSEDSVIGAFVSGVYPGDFNKALNIDYPRSMHDLLTRVYKEIRGEESNRAKYSAFERSMGKQKRREEMPTPENLKRGKIQDRMLFPRVKREDRPRYTDEDMTPLNATRTQIIHQIGHGPILRKPPRLNAPDHKRDRSKFCIHHGTHGHNTDECEDLKVEIEAAVRRGELD